LELGQPVALVVISSALQLPSQDPLQPQGFILWQEPSHSPSQVQAISHVHPPALQQVQAQFPLQVHFPASQQTQSHSPLHEAAVFMLDGHLPLLGQPAHLPAALKVEGLAAAASPALTMSSAGTTS
jgi:hypothetical protein